MNKDEEKCYYEEILFLLDVIIALFCYSNRYVIFTYIFGLKAAFDFYCSNKYAFKSLKNKQRKGAKGVVKHDTLNKCHTCEYLNTEFDNYCNDCFNFNKYKKKLI